MASFRSIPPQLSLISKPSSEIETSITGRLVVRIFAFFLSQTALAIFDKRRPRLLTKPSTELSIRSRTQSSSEMSFVNICTKKFLRGYALASFVAIGFTFVVSYAVEPLYDAIMGVPDGAEWLRMQPCSPRSRL